MTQFPGIQLPDQCIESFKNCNPMLKFRNLQQRGTMPLVISDIIPLCSNRLHARSLIVRICHKTCRSSMMSGVRPWNLPHITADSIHSDILVFSKLL